MRTYGLALPAGARPALLHVTGDSIEHVNAPPMNPAELVERVQRMDAWLSGPLLPEPARDFEICQRCSVQGPCWARWGRTLPLSVPVEPPPPAPADAARVPPTAPLRGAASPSGGGDESLLLGTMEDGGMLRLPPAVLCKHVCALGSSGSGKTWLAKVLVEEALLQGVPVIAFDVQGDLVHLAAGAGGPLDLPAELIDRRARLRALVEPRVWTPASAAGRRLSLSPLWVPEPGLDDEKLALCADAVAAAVLSLTRTPPAWRHVAQQAIADEVVAAAADRRTLDFQDLGDRVAAHPALKAAERERLRRDLRLLSEGRNRFLYATGETPRIDRFLAPEQPGKVPLNVVFLNTGLELEARQRVVAALLSQVYAWMQRAPAAGTRDDGRPRLLLFLDEVGPYMPPVRDVPSKAILRALFKEGRKYGVAGVFCSQNVTDVDYKVLGQANTKLVGRVAVPQDQKRVREMVPRATEDQLRQLPGLRHRFLVDCPDVLGEQVGLLAPRPLLTGHGPPWTEDELAQRLGGT